MRTDTMHGLQMLCMHQDSSELIAVHLKAKENAKSHIIDAALHRAVHCLRMVCIVMLWSGWMQLFVALLVVGLLKQHISTDTGIL